MDSSSERWGFASFQVEGAEGPVTIIVSGRLRWALENLIEAGPKGCTPIDTPGPRWSVYVHDLRGLGLKIETIHEAHGGPFAGTHARYILRSEVTRAHDEGEAA